jgi:hypothetical protein
MDAATPERNLRTSFMHRQRRTDLDKHKNGKRGMASESKLNRVSLRSMSMKSLLAFTVRLLGVS